MKIKPTLDQEKKLWAEGLKYIGGIDEAGRGAWAGPVVAAVVILPKMHVQVDSIKDSKLLTPKKRQELYEIITNKNLDFGVGIISHRIIDKVGIGEATKLAAKEAINMLKNQPDYLLTDALDLTSHFSCQQKSVIKGDQKIYSISCASIIAKVTRDNLMSNLGSDYEHYEFYLHKGYGTKRHQELLARYGPSDLHRFSYKPIKRYL
jgi:ribonuclease HII